MSDVVKFEVQFLSSAAKEFRNLPQEIKKRAITKIDSLASNPFPKASKKLKGKNDFYRIRIGPYRVIFEIRNDENIILITRIRHRSDVYK